MKTNNSHILFQLLKRPICFTLFLILFCGCEDFLELNEPFGQIPHQEVFEDEATATAAVTTLYGKLRDQTLISGNLSGLGFIMGLYADELDYYSTPGFPLEFIYQHQVLPSNPVIETLWSGSYNVIHLSNAVLEGLNRSETLSQTLKNQLKGEVLFIRALTHFYLVNCFGDVPYVTTTDFEFNSTVSRIQSDIIYDNIITDLKEAKLLLENMNISNENTRVNKWIVSALMARIYLYIEHWEEAEYESSLLINNSTMFSMEPNIFNEFLKDSPSTIFQLKPKSEGDNTLEGSIYIFTSGMPPFAALNENLINNMDENDLRKEHWIGQVTDETNNWYFPHKYKQNANTGMSIEYSIVFRLAEQYLIRAESRLMQGNIEGTQQDLNIVRNRVGLSNITSSTTMELLDIIMLERQFELFTEHGHRWFDIKRLNRANQILSTLKPGWKPTNILLPLPESELIMNPNLNPQNPGY